MTASPAVLPVAPHRALALERERAEQRQLFLAGGALFAAYYVVFWALGIYSRTSLATGLVMAAGLVGVGLIVRAIPVRWMEPTHVFVALLLGAGATTSAAFSDGSHCIGFHTLWALPLIYGLFIREGWAGSATVAVGCFAGGVTLLVRDGESPSRIAQWATLAASAGAFGFIKLTLDRRNLRLTVAESELAQSRLAVADRMASVGMLAAGVAHEINNPISFVASNVEYAARQITELQQRAGVAGGDSELKGAMDDALVGCARVTAIVKTLSRLSREKGGPSGEVDLNRALADILRLSRRELDPIASVKFDAGELQTIQGDESRLGQVFLNLLVNCAHAVEQRPNGPKSIAVRTFRRAPADVVVEFADSGCGIPPAALPHIFDPFFTTKPVGKGTGLGLALCAEIVNEHSGKIEVESEEGRGTIVRVVLPGRVPADLPPQPAPIHRA